MMDKIARALTGKKGLIAYVTAGFPDYAECERAVLAAVEEGADVIELGLPFSDPLADGPILQKASADALAAGSTTEKTLRLAKGLRQKTAAPLLVMSYINPIAAFGVKKFAAEAAEAGIDGLILPDVPEEEKDVAAIELDRRGLSRIPFVAPTSGEERIAAICGKAQTGFIYCLARTGVTGAGGGFDRDTETLVRTARKYARLPIAIGFGITDAKAARQAAEYADAAIVGSALVDTLRQGGAPAVGSFVRSLRRELDRCG
ncbi:MAG: tryptophan synthase subunit alpha [Acidaminococcales bacterium]|jgi:tryptophan synthase alpha chain|nr:tryptophan synthase subunit alpha [Acidaminococcales bacterium]